jgi:DNA-binding NarL/FixJ family response regulator
VVRDGMCQEGIRLRVFLMCAETGLCLALRQFFLQEPELTLVGEAADAASCLAQVEVVQADLLVLDRDLPGLQTVDLLSALHGLDDPPKVVIFGRSPKSCREALTAGADAFVCREEPVEQLLLTIEKVGGLSPYFAA